MGPFFARLANWLDTQGHEVYKVNFNGGDQLFYRRKERVAAYTGRHEAFSTWFEVFLKDRRIDAVVLFGQHRPVHEMAREVASRLNLPVFVFEEGYLRPDYITLEVGGVNGLSAVPRDLAAYRALPDTPPPRPEPVQQRFVTMAWYATLYSWAMLLMWPRYRHHRYHRPLHPVTQALQWLRGGLRKLWHGWVQRKYLSLLSSPERSGRYFLLPLQVHNDSQILCHSPYPSIEAVIDDVMASFARHARREDWLVIKHHPMDRAYRCYARHIRQRAEALGLRSRVLYVHDLHLPTLLRHARGVVTVNSTVGLQALYHRAPVITLGECFYDVPGLVHRGPLASFWREPGTVEVSLLNRFQQYLVRRNQVNASFYGYLPALERPMLRVAPTESSELSVLSQPLPLDERTTIELPLAVSRRPGEFVNEPQSANSEFPAFGRPRSSPESWAVTRPMV